MDGSIISKEKVEQAHSLQLPVSARDLQQKRMGGIADRGILSLFEIDQDDVQQFVAQLEIRSRNLPAKTGYGNPCVNGWNVWPTNSPTFVPGNKEFEGLKPTWTGQATPIEMLSCRSPKGDWLHVEIWSVDEHALIKLYTDWN